VGAAMADLPSWKGACGPDMSKLTEARPPGM
jgi:hypothetical protein